MKKKKNYRPKKLRHFPLFILFLFSIKNGHPETLPPIVIEAKKPSLENLTPLSVGVTVGNSSQLIDLPRNELGVELGNMEYLEELSETGRNHPWFLRPPLENQTTQIQGDFSLDQKINAKKFFDKTSLVQFGFFRDHKKITFLDNHSTPYDPSDDFINTYPSSKDQGYGKFYTQGKRLETLTEINAKKEDIRLTSTLLGKKSQIQGNLSGKYKLTSTEFLPFFQLKKQNFESQNPFLFSNKNQSLKYGVQIHHPLSQNLVLHTHFSRENFNRTWADQTQALFFRNDFKLMAKAEFVKSWIELESHSFIETVWDQNSLSARESQWAWDAGFGASSSHQHPFGVGLKIRRFALFPTPLQRFGDGAGLAESPDLPTETGLRFSLGPWWKNAQSDLELLGFLEQSRHSPIQVASTPSQVKTLSIGGVWSRGLELKGQITSKRFTVKNSSLLQNALNASQINWQTGKKIPGRPDWIIHTDIEWNQNPIKIGLGQTFRSSETLDLAGILEKPSSFLVRGFVSYGKRDWEIRLMVNNVYLKQSYPNSPDTNTLAGANLLEPEILQTEVRLQWEIIL